MVVHVGVVSPGRGRSLAPLGGELRLLRLSCGPKTGNSEQPYKNINIT